MYIHFFSLQETPFSIAPNPRYLYMSERHSEALAHLTYGLRESGGFVLLTGEVGTGKTTVTRALLQQLSDQTDVAYVLNPTLTERDLLATLCEEFKLPYSPEAGIKELFDRLRDHLLSSLAQGRKCVVIIDEAQQMQPAALEQLRLLTNLETDEKKLLQIVLIGQPELQQLLRLPLLRQLAQRITARYHLLPLTATEVDAYVRFRLQVAGTLQPIFPPRVIKTLHRLSGGIPRLINLICDRALLIAYAHGQQQVTSKQITQAAFEVTGERDEGGTKSLLLFMLLGGLFIVLGWFGWQQYGIHPQPRVVRIEVPVIDDQRQSQQEALAQSVSTAQELNLAWQNLFRLWGYEVMSEEANCGEALRAGLSCLEGTGTLAELEKLQHPAVVTLLDEQQIPYQAVLAGVTKTQAILLIGEERWAVERPWFEQQWQRDYSLLWRQPIGGGNIIAANSGGDAILWLDDALARALGKKPTKSRSFGNELKLRLQTYQQQQGLKADGVAGPQTLVRLNAIVDNSMPRLKEHP